MSDFLEACDKYFDTRDFYEVLQIKRNASFKDIKKAYHKLSLLVHPDRVSDENKKEATEKFKVLGKIHSILADKNMRDIYDESGEFDGEYDALFNWLDYWRSLFKPITKEDIENYEKEYIGSDTEKNDVKKAYLASKGNMDYIMETVPFSSCESEPRIIEMVKKMIENDEVPEYKSFIEEPAWKKDRRQKKWEKEKAEAAGISEDDLNKAIQESHARREKTMTDLISSLEAKYGGKNKKKRASIKASEDSPSKRTRSKK